MKMTVKEVPATTFLCSSHRLTIPEIPAIAARVISPLFAAAKSAQLMPYDAVHFLFNGCDGNPEVEFAFDIALAVQDVKAVGAPFTIKSAPTFKCAALEYKGAMSTIGNGYMTLIEQIEEAGLEPTDESREIYLHWVDYDSEENITELQIGVL